MTVRVHPSFTPLLFRVPSFERPTQHLSVPGTACLGFLPLRDFTGARPQFREGSQLPATVRPQAFSASRRLSPLSGSAGLFHPAATSRVHPVQGLLPALSHPSSSEGACPPAVGTSSLASRSQLHSRCPSTSRPYSARGCVRSTWLFTVPTAAPLFRFLSSRSSLFPPSVPIYSEPPLLVFSVDAFACALTFDRSPPAYAPRETRLICLQIADLLEFSSLPSENPVSRNLPMTRLSALSDQRLRLPTARRTSSIPLFERACNRKNIIFVRNCIFFSAIFSNFWAPFCE